MDYSLIHFVIEFIHTFVFITNVYEGTRPGLHARELVGKDTERWGTSTRGAERKQPSLAPGAWGRCAVSPEARLQQAFL